MSTTSVRIPYGFDTDGVPITDSWITPIDLRRIHIEFKHIPHGNWYLISAEICADSSWNQEGFNSEKPR